MENKKKIGPKRKYTKKVVLPRTPVIETNPVIEQPITPNKMYSIELVSASPITHKYTKKVVSPINPASPVKSDSLIKAVSPVKMASLIKTASPIKSASPLNPVQEEIQVPPPIKKRKYTKKRIEKEPYIIPIESSIQKMEKTSSPIISEAVVKIKRTTKKKKEIPTETILPPEQILMPEYIENPIPIMEISTDEKKEIKQKIEEYKENGYSIYSSIFCLISGSNHIPI
jgi:hypothetical protein